MGVFDGTYYKITITNYISKTSLYTTFRMYSLGPWPLKILLGLLLILILKSWGCHPGTGHAFPIQQHMRRGEGYLFLSGFSSLYDAIHGWMTGRMDGWMDGSPQKASPNTTTTSFIICNNIYIYIYIDTAVSHYLKLVHHKKYCVKGHYRSYNLFPW